VYTGVARFILFGPTVGRERNYLGRRLAHAAVLKRLRGAPC
jgi:hypothetical protein